MTYVDITTLSKQEQDTAAALISLLPQTFQKSLVTLGAYRGSSISNQRLHAPWDLRLIFLSAEHNNSLLMMRIANPESKIPERIQDSWGRLPSLLKNSYIASGSGNCFILGQEHNIFWSLRKYCEYTLENLVDLSFLENLKSSVSSDCLNIIMQLSELETRLISHSHVTKSNIGVDKSHLCLLDPWMYSISSNTQQNLDATSQDINYVTSLASLFLNLFGSTLDSELIIAFQNVLTSNHQTTSFRDLLVIINNHRSAPASLEKSKVTTDSNQSNQQQEDPAAFSSLSKSTSVAPSGRLISPHLKNSAVEKKLAAQISPDDQEISKSTPISKISRANVLGIQLPNRVINNRVINQKFLSNRGLVFFSIALLVAFLVMLSSKALRFSPSSAELKQMQEDWESNIPKRLEHVAQAALEDQNQAAQDIIELDLLSGNSRAGVNPNFLKVALNELWRDELSSSDKLFTFSISLAGIYRIPSSSLPPLEELHPGVLLSLIGDMSLQSSQGKFDSISVEQFSVLPASYGGVFKGLIKLGITSFSEISARAAARLITGANDSETFDYYINPNLGPEETEQRLALIAAFCEKYPELAKLMLTSLAQRSDYLAERVKWFIEDPIAQWNQIEETSLVYIVLGLMSESIQNFERIVDLLQYPNLRIRDQAKAKLLTMLGKPQLADLLDILTIKPSLLTRSQAIGILAAIRLPAEKVAPFLAHWLESQPDPKVVLQFLLSTRQQLSYESNFVQLANYLAKTDFEVSSKQLPLLLSHPESLARALAFSKLDASKIVDRRLLEAWFKTETSPRLKQQIQIKLNEALQVEK